MRQTAVASGSAFEDEGADDNNMDDLHVLHSVCSSYWDDIAEDYVDEAGRCFEAIVSAPPTLALYEVTVDTVGIVGVQVNRPKCRDYTEMAVSPSPPAEMCLVVSFLRNGEVFATTPLSQPLKAAFPHGDDPSIVSDISSLEASFMDFSPNYGGAHSTSTEPIRQVLGIWGKANDGKRDSVTFDSCLEVSSRGEETSEIDVVVYLVDMNHPPSSDTKTGEAVNSGLANVPLAVGSLRIAGNGAEKRMVCDIPLYEPFDGQPLPTLHVANPNLGSTRQEQQAQALVTAAMPKKKKNRVLGKLFKPRNKKIAEEISNEEKKEEDDDDDTQSVSLSPPASFVNDAYSLDDVQGAFLRFNVEWKEKEINFEVNLHDSLPISSTKALTKENSMKENTTQSHDDPVTVQEEPISRGPDEPLEALQPVKKEVPEKQPSGKPPMTSKSVARTTSVSSTASPQAKSPKKNKTMKFFFKKKKSDEKKAVVTLPEPPIVGANNHSGDRSVAMMPQEEERSAMAEPDDEAKKAAMLLERREGSTPGSVADDDSAFQENPVDSASNSKTDEEETSPSVLDSMFKAMVGHSKAEVVLNEGSVETGTKSAGNELSEQGAASDDDETAHSIFDSMYKAMVGTSKAEIVPDRVDMENRSAASESQASRNTSRSGKKVGDIVPTGTAFCQVLASPMLDDTSMGRETKGSRKEEEADSSEQNKSVAHETVVSEAGFELTSDSGLYAQFVQATTSLLGRVEGYPHVELKQLEMCAQLERDPAPALEPAVPVNTTSCKETDLTNERDMEQAPRRSGPIDIDAVDDGEIALSDEEQDLAPRTPTRTTSPPPGDMSMERILSWDERQIEGRKSAARFAFGRRGRGHSGGESIKSAPAHSFRQKKNNPVPVSLASQIDFGNADPPVSTEWDNQASKKDAKREEIKEKYLKKPIYQEPIARKASLKPPSSLPRHTRESSKFNKKDRGTQKEKEDDPPSPSKGADTPKRRYLWGKIFKSKSSSNLIINPQDSEDPKEPKVTVPIERSNASVVSDAETVEIDNMARASVIEALGEKEIPPSPIPVRERIVSNCKSEDSAFVSQHDDDLKLLGPRAGFSLFDMFGKGDDDIGTGPVKVDGKEAWLYARDDETCITKESQTTSRPSSNDDELTVIPSPADVLLSETYHRCGPARIADLGDAVLEEARQFFRDKSDTETLETFTFDDPTFDPSVLSNSVTSKTRSIRSSPSRTARRSGSTPNITPSPSSDKHSPKGVTEFGRLEDQSKVEAFSEAFMNFLTCRSSGRDPLNGAVPSELIRRNDTDSVGDDLTLTTYEMQVEIEQYKKKIEQVRHQAECLDENGDEVGDDAALVFQSPNMGGRSTPMPGFEA